MSKIRLMKICNKDMRKASSESYLHYLIASTQLSSSESTHCLPSVEQY